MKKGDTRRAATIMKDSDLRYRLALKFTEGVGNVGIRNLLSSFGNAAATFRASPEDLKRVEGINARAARNILSFRDWRRVDRELDTAAKKNVSIITAEDALFPRYLLNIYDCPAVLYLRGTLRKDDVNVAVVGSRVASTYGKYTTERLSRELTLRGITVVSGLARGIDAAAHRGALLAKGRTIAVLGSGIDVIYPPEHRELFERIAERGAVMSEFPLETPPNATNFPARNRIISGMSLGVVVVEAGERSGSLITARTAMEQGREVFAVPGSIDASGSRGTHKLIRQGAKLIENIHDILEEILPQVDEAGKKRLAKEGPAPDGRVSGKNRTGKVAALDEDQMKILGLISRKPMDPDGIIAATGLKAQEVMRTLLTLELTGLVEQLPGKRFVRKDHDA
ncbi:MAG TPA: DNA-processing protein DprA [Syntrophales bacterium]|nr:DNA-processing protein DprA [Syntrophales bacterium]HPI57180.1 DNA-processing protein DprA [Syntrophales bacterium]HPN23436.1 DNA-processing protein DprA [Syntrophales bacterium]HQM28039.1 DNA-processing protein DprA [Syntrophales bacterium]